MYKSCAVNTNSILPNLGTMPFACSMVVSTNNGGVVASIPVVLLGNISCLSCLFPDGYPRFTHLPSDCDVICRNTIDVGETALDAKIV